MVSININNINYKVPKFLTIFQACDFLNIKIPHFCYHDKLSIAGNCRMCLVEEKKSLKPLASCAININSNLKIFTETLLVKKSREGVLEFLLANHPLDCPICDQGGECDLQDQSIIFGGDRGRFYEIKRSVEDKDCGPLIKTIMNRCIHCTRCIRFSQEISGVSNLNLTGRGSSMEVGFYIESFLNSEVSGNIIDLCPVGALTSKPYTFLARSWELRHYESIDILDSLGSNIRIDTRGSNIMRILPRLNESINEEWITDKIRFMYDGLVKQRLVKPLLKIRRRYFISISWIKIFFFIKNFFYNIIKFLIKEKIKFFFLRGFLGNFNDLLSISVFKDFLNSFGSNFLESTQDHSFYNISLPYNYLLNTSFFDLNKVDLCFFIGTNPSLESPLLNIRLRKLKLSKKINFYSFGFFFKSNFFIKSLGNDSNSFLRILEGNHWFCNKLLFSNFPYFLFGSSFMQRYDFLFKFIQFLPKVYKNLLTTKWNGFNILHQNSSKVNAFDLGFYKSGHSQLSLTFSKKCSFIYYFFGADDLFFNFNFSKNNLIIFQNSHGNFSLLNYATVILPQLNFIEKNSLYINNQGLLQKTKCIFKSKNLAKSDWKIIKGFSDLFFFNNNLNSLSCFQKRLKEQTPYVDFKRINYVFFSYKNNFFNFFNSLTISFIHNFYLNDSLSRSSKVMSHCSNYFYNRFYNF